MMRALKKALSDIHHLATVEMWPLWRAVRFVVVHTWRRLVGVNDDGPHRVTHLRCSRCGDAWTAIVPHADNVRRIIYECGKCMSMSAREDKGRPEWREQ